MSIDTGCQIKIDKINNKETQTIENFISILDISNHNYHLIHYYCNDIAVRACSMHSLPQA